MGKRFITDKDIKKYDRMVTKYLRDNIQKNWKEANLNDSDNEVGLGNTGMTMADMRQYVYMQVVIALQNYDPERRNAQGVGAKESTFVYTHLFNRVGQFMKKLTKEKSGYGKWTMNLEDVIKENNEAE